jgi:hypothetical protein
MSDLLKSLMGDLPNMAKEAKEAQKETLMALYAIITRLTEIRDVLVAIQKIEAKKPMVQYTPVVP